MLSLSMLSQPMRNVSHFSKAWHLKEWFLYSWKIYPSSLNQWYDGLDVIGVSSCHISIQCTLWTSTLSTGNASVPKCLSRWIGLRPYTLFRYSIYTQTQRRRPHMGHSRSTFSFSRFQFDFCMPLQQAHWWSQCSAFNMTARIYPGKRGLQDDSPHLTAKQMKNCIARHKTSIWLKCLDGKRIYIGCQYSYNLTLDTDWITAQPVSSTSNSGLLFDIANLL